MAQDMDRNSRIDSSPGSGPSPPAADSEEIVIGIESDLDIVVARQRGRALAVEMGFEGGDLAFIATAISELARNIVSYARRGEIALRKGAAGGRRFVIVISRDRGPGIADVARAMRDGFSTSGGLGLGLPGVRRVMDEFEIKSEPGEGTTVMAKKWKR